MAELTRGTIAPIDPRRLRRLGAAHTVRKMLRSASQTPFRNTAVQIGGTVGSGAGIDTDLTTFLALTDTPDSYTGQSLKGIRVNAGETALEFYAAATTFLALTDTPASYVGASLKGVRVNAGETALEFYTISNTFLSLTDTPASYAGASLKGVRVNVGETALEFFDVPVVYWSKNATPTPDVVYETTGTYDIAFGGSDDTASFFFDVANNFMYWGGSKSSGFPRGIEDAGSSLRFVSPVQQQFDYNAASGSPWPMGLYQEIVHTKNYVGSEYTNYLLGSRSFDDGALHVFAPWQSSNNYRYAFFNLTNASTVRFDSFANLFSYISISDVAGTYQRSGVGLDGLIHFKAAITDNGTFSQQTVWDVEHQGCTRNNFCTLQAPITFGAPPAADLWTFVFANNCTSPDNLNPMAVAGNVVKGTAMLGMPPMAVPVTIYVKPVFDVTLSNVTQVGGPIEYTVIETLTNIEVTINYPGTPHHYDNWTVMTAELSLVAVGIPQVSVLVRREYNTTS